VCVIIFFFFFQAEDGIRDGHVTGVQTCALPILGRKDSEVLPTVQAPAARSDMAVQVHNFCGTACHGYPRPESFPRKHWRSEVERSEERRVGKEGRARRGRRSGKKKDVIG